MSSRLTCHEKYKVNEILVRVFLLGSTAPPPLKWARASYRGFYITHNDTPQSVGLLWTSQRPLPDITQHSQQTSMPPVGFEPTISPGERPQTARLLGPEFRFLHEMFSHMMSNRTMLLVPFNFLLSFTCISLCGFQRSLNPLYAGYNLRIKKQRDCVVCHSTRKTNGIFLNLIFKLRVGREC